MGGREGRRDGEDRERERCVEGMLSNSSGKQKDLNGFLGLIHKLLILIS